MSTEVDGMPVHLFASQPDCDAAAGSEQKPTSKQCTEAASPPDGGWGWVVLAATFLCAAVVDGMCSVFGVLMSRLLLHFESSRAKTALAGSVLAGGFMFSGPLASVMINMFGCRATTMFGSVMSTAAFVGSTWSPDIDVFILVFGGLGGVGLGLIYVPATVIISFYFERRRALAQGISSAGAGVGMLVMAPLASYLAQEYNWSGALILVSCIPLNCAVWGALMRPLRHKKAFFKSKLVTLKENTMSRSNSVHLRASVVSEQTNMDLVRAGELRRSPADNFVSCSTVHGHGVCLDATVASDQFCDGITESGRLQRHCNGHITRQEICSGGVALCDITTEVNTCDNTCTPLRPCMTNTCVNAGIIVWKCDSDPSSNVLSSTDDESKNCEVFLPPVANDHLCSSGECSVPLLAAADSTRRCTTAKKKKVPTATLR